jgi:hypothetical protein
MSILLEHIRLEATDLVGLLVGCESVHFGVMFVS